MASRTELPRLSGRQPARFLPLAGYREGALREDVGPAHMRLAGPSRLGKCGWKFRRNERKGDQNAVKGRERILNPHLPRHTHGRTLPPLLAARPAFGGGGGGRR